LHIPDIQVIDSLQLHVYKESRAMEIPSCLHLWCQYRTINPSWLSELEQFGFMMASGGWSGGFSKDLSV
jgi:hypothetical protein